MLKLRETVLAATPALSSAIEDPASSANSVTRYPLRRQKTPRVLGSDDRRVRGTRYLGEIS